MRFKFFILLSSILLIIIACKKEENFSSRITFVNAAVSNPAITLKADSQQIFSALPYDSLLNATTPSGTFGLTLFVNSIAQQPFTTNLEAGQQYLGMTYADTAGRGGYFIRKDALPATPADGQCAIRIFNAIADSSILYLANDTALQKRVIGGLTFGNFLFNSTFINKDTITNASIRIDSSKLVTRLPGPLLPGKIYTLYIIGRMKDTLTGTRKPKVIMQVHN